MTIEINLVQCGVPSTKVNAISHLVMTNLICSNTAPQTNAGADGDPVPTIVSIYSSVHNESCWGSWIIQCTLIPPRNCLSDQECCCYLCDTSQSDCLVMCADML